LCFASTITPNYMQLARYFNQFLVLDTMLQLVGFIPSMETDH